MAKIIVAKGDTVLQEMDLSKERITIGRRSYNDVVIDDLVISGEHAVIVTEKGDSFLEDLNSTNGTQINGQPVRKHFLRDQDVIVLAQYTLTYLEHAPGDNSRQGRGLTKIRFFECKEKVPVLTFLNGVNAGKKTLLTKPITTIGQLGAQVAVVAICADEYVLMHIDGDAYPMVNGRSIGRAPYSLIDGDVIDLQCGKMKFFLS
jgi:hypothetical protein